MKLFYVIYVGSQVGGSVGPLPYDLAECQLRAAEDMQAIERRIESGKAVDGSPLPEAAQDIRFVCEFHAKRPEITVN